ncbi:hypothetical protein GCM10020331_081910 [Ectobacillus funiculus]
MLTFNLWSLLFPGWKYKLQISLEIELIIMSGGIFKNGSIFARVFFSALLAIIVIDLVLAGDNAIVIGLAARRLPKDQQKGYYLGGQSVR